MSAAEDSSSALLRGGDELSAAGDVPPAAISADDIAVAVRVLAAVSGDAELRASRDARKLRVAVLALAAQLREGAYGGGSPEEYLDHTRRKLAASVQRQQQKQSDRNYINKTALRAARISRVAALANQGDGAAAVPFLLDGAVETTEAAPTALLCDATAAPASDSAAAVAAAAPSEELPPDTDAPAVPARLSTARACYVCKVRFWELHHFYDTLCPRCAALNWKKRHLSAALDGRVALVTGARVKIGFHCALKLLRAGCVVIATSRFPVDAAKRFADQPDSGAWSDRLHVFGLDLRDLTALEEFCALLSRRFDRLDFVVNNACQTVRRPPAYYAPLLEGEATPPSAMAASVASTLRLHVAGHAGAQRAPPPALEVGLTDGARGVGSLAHPRSDGAPSEEAGASAGAPLPAEAAAVAPSTSAPFVSPSAAMSQLALLPGDALVDTQLFPQGRSSTRWRLALHRPVVRDGLSRAASALLCRADGRQRAAD